MATKKPAPETLDAYRAKRSPETTPEPFGGGARPGLFVVHKHSATRLHWDLRLEMGGVLRSWAVPKGPSLDPAEKRFAAEVEDHPTGYADFEGIIPEGNYGAGPMIVWDRGLWTALEDVEKGYAKGKLLFALKGYKLRGVFTLVRIKGSRKDWLFIKHADAYSKSGPSGFPEESILSGLTVDELRDAGKRREELRADLRKTKAPHRGVAVRDVTLMLAQPIDAPFSAKGWLFELKCDGYRLLAAREMEGVVLRLRGGSDAAATFPEVAAAVQSLPYEGLILDGELVVPDEAGHPSFSGLQKRAQLQRRADVARGVLERPAVYWVFDLLALEGFDLRPLPLALRKEFLKRILSRAGPVRFLDHVEEEGVALYEAIDARNLEGIVAKKASAPYRGGRSDAWRKLRRERSGDFAVVGYSAPKGTRAGFGALHIAAVEPGRGLVYAGSVGTGFDQKQLAAAAKELETARREKAPCVGTLPTTQGTEWVTPHLVAEVRYKERTPAGLLRHPVFLRFRDDKTPEECEAEMSAENAPALPTKALRVAPEREERKVVFSRTEKIFWPKEGYTKGDLLAYYRAISRFMLPYLADRLVVLTRYPDGIEGKSFFQKDAPAFTPGWLRTERMWSGDAGREIDAFVCDDEASLLFLVNLGTIPFHVWASRVKTIGNPDWCILDLDPKDAPFTDVVKTALAAKELCDSLELPAFVKTSGSTGLHVLIPLGGACTFDEAKSFGEVLARVLAQRLPEIATVIRTPAARGGRVYVDFLQNGQGKLLAAPFSARPVPGALVSTPLEWKEVNRKLDISAFTIATVPKRLEKRGADPLLSVLTLRPDLSRALEILSGG